MPKPYDVVPVLRPGCVAFLDVYGSPPIACKVERIYPAPGSPPDFRKVPSSDVLCDVRLTTRNPVVLKYYRPGERLQGIWSLHVIPRPALRRHRFGTRIGHYTIETED